MRIDVRRGEAMEASEFERHAKARCFRIPQSRVPQFLGHWQHAPVGVHTFYGMHGAVYFPVVLGDGFRRSYLARPICGGLDGLAWSMHTGLPRHIGLLHQDCRHMHMLDGGCHEANVAARMNGTEVVTPHSCGLSEMTSLEWRSLLTLLAATDGNPVLEQGT